VTRVFADSFCFLALFNPHDAAHERALAASGSLRGPLVTTDWILTETADALCDPINRLGCTELINDLRSSPDVEIEPASRTWFEAG
jgi:predicted nucleic acid-binding protein